MKSKAVRQLIKIEADAQGSYAVPARIHLMSAGKWQTPYHGNFEMTPGDLSQMVANFNDGVGLVDESKRAPINYGHDQGGKAAGWINNLALEGDELWGDIEWTPAARQAMIDGEWRYISPEWNPRSVPWQNPQVDGEEVDNVFNGAALTNIPLFTKLKPLRQPPVDRRRRR
jgi:Mu-like prophage I protein